VGRSQDIGNDAEDLACAYLQERGLRLRERNYRTRLGELDLICEDGDTLVFVEVRYRNSRSHGGGQDKLVKTALYYLQQHPRLARRAARFDVIAIRPGPAGPHIDWIPNAFEASA